MLILLWSGGALLPPLLTVILDYNTTSPVKKYFVGKSSQLLDLPGAVQSTECLREWDYPDAEPHAQSLDAWGSVAIGTAASNRAGVLARRGFWTGRPHGFYHFLAVFPSLLIFFTISARVPHLGDHMKNAFQDLTREVLPDQASQLFQQIMNELNDRTHSNVPLISVFAGALWAGLNGTWAMVYGLNKAYEVEEHRSWRELSITIGGLTAFLGAVGCVVVYLVFCSAYLQTRFHEGAMAVRVLEWLVLAGSLGFSFAVLYRFAPNLRDCEWRWSTPGAFCAVVLWITATFVTRLYFGHVNNYSRSYGHLNGVVMLLLWLYVSNGAILIGGEMNSEIEKHNGEAAADAVRQDRSRTRK